MAAIVSRAGHREESDNIKDPKRGVGKLTRNATVGILLVFFRNPRS